MRLGLGLAKGSTEVSAAATKFDTVKTAGVREFEPIADDIGAAVGRMDLGAKLGGAVEVAAPQMADRMAAQIPRMASAFGNDVLHAGATAAGASVRQERREMDKR